MKKEFLQDMEKEKIIYLIKLNSKLADILLQDLYHNNMDCQLFAFEDILNKEGQEAIQYHDNYTSFYHTLIDWRKFITNISRDYLSVNTLPIYDKIIQKIDVLDSMNPYSDDYYNLESYLEKEAGKVLEDMDAYLHEFEEYPNIDDAIQYAIEMEQLDGYYIEIRDDGTSDNVLRRDVVYTETFI